MSETSQTAHTPGPWTLGPTDGIGQRGRLRVVDAAGAQIADCEAPKRTDDPLRYIRHLPEDEANAHLIAAAPDLLAAAVDAENWLDNHGAEDDEGAQELLAMFRAAIAKAEGR